jgi:hypothetical protein
MSKSLNRMVMERAIELVESGWTKGLWAQDRNGKPRDWDSGEAVAFCAVGAIMRATHELLGMPRPLVWSFGRMGFLTGDEAREMIYKNDEGTQESALMMLREKLAAL